MNKSMFWVTTLRFIGRNNCRRVSRNPVSLKIKTNQVLGRRAPTPPKFPTSTPTTSCSYAGREFRRRGLVDGMIGGCAFGF
jgi:hypothetical protein